MNLEKVSPEDITQYFQDNHHWISDWLSNVVIIPPKNRDDRFNVFQTFKININQNPNIEPVLNIIEATQFMKANILMQTVFGMSKKVGNAVDKKFPSFVQLTKRLPINGDLCLFTATKWFAIEHESFLTGVKGKPILKTVCTVDFIPKPLEIEEEDKSE